MWVWRRCLRSAHVGLRLVYITHLAVRNVTQLARAFPSQTVLFLNVREAGQNAHQPPIEALRYGG